MISKVSFYIAFISLFKIVTTQNMSGHIVGGFYAEIESFPHSVFLCVTCDSKTSLCGASILSQLILITAGHCLSLCVNKQILSMYAYTGHVQKFKGSQTKVIDFKLHENYGYTSLDNDIALALLQKALEFSEKVRRVAVMKKPPYYKVARIAGTGRIDDFGAKSNELKYTYQTVIDHDTCKKQLGYIPVGTICGSYFDLSHPQRGDSGSALVIHDFIQIGVASCFMPSSNTTSVYTDVTYYYDWIQDAAHDLYTRHSCE